MHDLENVLCTKAQAIPLAIAQLQGIMLASELYHSEVM